MNFTEKNSTKKIRIDCHVHIFPDAVKKSRENYRDDPSFALLYTQREAKIENASGLVAAMDTAGTDLACAMGFPWEDPDRLSMHNDAILETAKKFPERILPFCCIHHENRTAVREAERCLDSGAAGIGEIACYRSDFTDKILDRLSPVMALCQERDVPVFIHVNDPLGHAYPGKAPLSLQGIEKLVTRFYANKIVLAHGGGGYPFYHLLRKGLPGNTERLFFDTAAFPYLYRSEIYPELVRILGRERLLFGSDWPLLSPERYFRDMKESGLSEEDLDAICGLNALRVLGSKHSSSVLAALEKRNGRSRHP